MGQQIPQALAGLLVAFAFAGCLGGASPPDHHSILILREVDVDEGTNATWPTIHTNMTELEERVPPLADAVRTAESEGKAQILEPTEIDAAWAFVEEKLGRTERGTIEFRLDGKAFLLMTLS